MTPDLVVFDCDGVLVDTETVTAKLIAASFTKYGHTISHHLVADLFTGGTMDDVFAEGRKRGANLPDTWLDEIYAEIYARLAQGVDLFDGVLDLLDALDALGVAQFVASNGTMQKMRLSLGPSGLWDRFGDRIQSRDTFAPKPDPAMILTAINRSDADPSKTFFVDDSTAGCRAGIAAGVHTIGFATEGQDADLSALGATVANTMAEVRHLILG